MRGSCSSCQWVRVSHAQQPRTYSGQLHGYCSFALLLLNTSISLKARSLVHLRAAIAIAELLVITLPDELIAKVAFVSIFS